MTLIDEAIRSVLVSDPAIFNLVGTRIFPLELPLDCSFPALAYSFPSDVFQRVFRPARLQVDCWAEDITECKNLKVAVETALNGYSGTVSGVNIEGIFPISPYDRPRDDTGLYHIAYDFKMIYRM